MSFTTRWTVSCCALVLATMFCRIAQADEKLIPTAGTENTANALDGDAPQGAANQGADPTTRPIDRGDNAWMLTSSALVLFMTAPGLAMFYGGLVRKKNVLGVMMQCVFLMGLLSVIWALYGYSLSFGGDPAADGAAELSRWIGNGDNLLLKGVGAEWRDGKAVIPTHPTLSIPWLTHMLFQGMFFIITPALICGALPNA